MLGMDGLGFIGLLGTGLGRGLAMLGRPPGLLAMGSTVGLRSGRGGVNRLEGIRLAGLATGGGSAPAGGGSAVHVSHRGLLCRRVATYAAANLSTPLRESAMLATHRHACVTEIHHLVYI